MDVGMVIALIAVATSFAGILTALVVTGKRKEQIDIFRVGNEELRKQLSDSDRAAERSEAKISALEDKTDAQAREILMLRDMVTNRTAITELAGNIADLRLDLAKYHAEEARARNEGHAESGKQHKAIVDVLERLVARMPAAAAAEGR